MKRFKLAAVASTVAAVSMLAAFAGAANAADGVMAGSASAPADPYVGKLLTVPDGTATTAMDFTAVITLNSVNGATTNMPAVTSFPVTLSIPAYSVADVRADEALVDPSGLMPGDQIGVESSIFGSSISGTYGTPNAALNNFEFDEPGIYDFTITETVPSSAVSGVVTTVTADGTSTLAYTNMTYDLKIEVVNNTATTDVDDDYFISSVAATVGADGTDGTDAVDEIPGHDAAGVKQDATAGVPGVPGTPGTDPVPGTDDINLTDVSFSNNYTYTPGDPSNPSATDGNIDIAKKATGDLADHTSTYFSFTSVVSLPIDPATGAASTAPLYAVILDDTLGTDPQIVGDPVTSNGIAAADVTAASAATIDGEALPAGAFLLTSTDAFLLRDGQHLHILNAPYGTTFSAGEAAIDNYVPNGDPAKVGQSTVAGTALSYAVNASDKVDTAWSSVSEATTAAWTVDNGFTANHMQIMTQGADAATTTNQILVDNYYDSSNNPLTGIVINNLPYIVIVVLALGGAVTYVVVKSRSRKIHTVSAGK
jgi:hypothetical protein